MPFITGDNHGKFNYIIDFLNLTAHPMGEVLIILGDVGLNYTLNHNDEELKRHLSRRLGKNKVFCIRGNHEARPQNILTYQTKLFWGGHVYYEPEFPNLLFAIDGELYHIPISEEKTISTLVVGGAYSPDKHYRLVNGLRWFSDEELDDEEWSEIFNRGDKLKNVDMVLSHTCPINYTPYEALDPRYNQTSISKTTEENLQKIYDIAEPKLGFCGHFHIQKKDRNLVFMDTGFLDLESEWDRMNRKEVF